VSMSGLRISSVVNQNDIICVNNTDGAVVCLSDVYSLRMSLTVNRNDTSCVNYIGGAVVCLTDV